MSTDDGCGSGWRVRIAIQDKERSDTTCGKTISQASICQGARVSARVTVSMGHLSPLCRIAGRLISGPARVMWKTAEPDSTSADTHTHTQPRRTAATSPAPRVKPGCPTRSLTSQESSVICPTSGSWTLRISGFRPSRHSPSPTCPDKMAGFF